MSLNQHVKHQNHCKLLQNFKEVKEKVQAASTSDSSTQKQANIDDQIPQAIPPSNADESFQSIDNFETPGDINESDLESMSDATFLSANELISMSSNFSDTMDCLMIDDGASITGLGASMFSAAEMIMDEINNLLRLIASMSYMDNQSLDESESKTKIDNVSKKLLETSDQLIGSMASLTMKLKSFSCKVGDDGGVDEPIETCQQSTKLLSPKELNIIRGNNKSYPSVVKNCGSGKATSMETIVKNSPYFVPVIVSPLKVLYEEDEPNTEDLLN